MTTPHEVDTREEAVASRSRHARQALGRLLHRNRSRLTRQSLHTTVAILKAQQEATLDGILVVSNSGKILTYNQRFLDIWGVPPEVATRGDDNELLGYAADAVADWDGFIELVNHIYTHPEEVRTGDPVILKDGRILSRASVPVVTGSTITGRAWYFRDVTEIQKSEKLQSALFRIAELSRESENLDAFYQAVHGVVGELMEATNFYIAEYDSEKNTISFPYFVDQFDQGGEGLPPGRGLTEYVLFSGEPLLARPDVFEEMVRRGEVETVGSPSVDWLGVPLKSGDRTWGVIAAQSYDEHTRYTERHKEILLFVSQHVASAIEHKRKEDALRSSELRYRQMFENNRAVQLLVDPVTGSVVDANVAACEFYGYSLEELRALHVWDINILPEEKVREEMANAAAQKRSYFNFQHRLASGEVRDVEVHSGPVDAGGRQLLYSIIHDITKRKRAEKALLQSEEKYRSIFDYAPVGIYQSRLDGRLITANMTLARMLGYESVEDLLEKNLTDDIYMRPEDREAIIRGHGAREHEVQWRKKDGSPLWIQLTAHVISQPNGTFYFEGFVHDIHERRRAESSLAAANAQRKAVLDAASRVSIIATDPDGLITIFNSGAERMLAYNAEEMIGQRSLLDIHVSDELAAHSEGLSAEFHRRISGFDVLAMRAAIDGLEEREWTYRRKNGRHILAHVSTTALRSEDGELTGFLHVATDITERKLAEEMLHKQSAAMTASMDGIAILDPDLRFTYANDSLAKLCGYASPAAMTGLPLHDIYDPVENERFSRIVLPLVQHGGRWRGEVLGRHRDESTFPQEMSLTAIDGGGMVCVVRDITERTYAEEQIKHLAYHDALTGLPNRLLFKDRLTVALGHAPREHSRLAVLFLDLDRFKVINDSLGHNIGDQLLQGVAARIQSCVRDTDTVSRLGGDEFTLLLPGLIHSEDAARVAEKILEAVRHPFHLDGREFFMTTSIGISLYPEDGADAETLIKNADTAMYQAKEEGRDNYQLFNAQVNAKALQRIALEHGLRRALSGGEMVMHYQPIFDLRTNCISGMEALLRWNHPEMGVISPSTFIPVAEAVGAMVPIGMWAMRQACMQAREWYESGVRDLALAVNLSVRQLQQPDLVQRVADILSETQLPPHLLEVEITESSAMENPEQSIKTLFELKKLGIRISLDDFGTGHSSLSYLKRFPIDTLKIDQSFVRDIITDSDTAAIVKAIIAMAHSLRLNVVAEGVEHHEQADFLRAHDCDQMQGFLIRVPVPAAEFTRMIALPA